MTTSKKGISLIEHFEGFYENAYKCPAGIWTIGIGTTVYSDGSPVRKGDRISYEKALEHLWHDVRDTERQVNEMLTVNLTQCQFDALVSFAYNVGCNALRNSTLLKVINGHLTHIPIENAFVMWNKVDGSKDGKDNDNDGQIDEPGEKKALVGLTNRRRSEAYLWLHDTLFYY